MGLIFHARLRFAQAPSRFECLDYCFSYLCDLYAARGSQSGGLCFVHTRDSCFVQNVTFGCLSCSPVLGKLKISIIPLLLILLFKVFEERVVYEPGFRLRFEQRAICDSIDRAL